MLAAVIIVMATVVIAMVVAMVDRIGLGHADLDGGGGRRLTLLIEVIAERHDADSETANHKIENIVTEL